MSNPEFKCAVFPGDNLHLGIIKEELQFEIKSENNHRNVQLSRESVARLIAELQSWVDTGEFVKPKKKFVIEITNQEKTFSCLTASYGDSIHQVITENQGAHVKGMKVTSAWELKPEDAIKLEDGDEER